MGILGDRISEFVEDRATTWKKRLRDWLGDALSFGFDIFFDILGKGLAQQTTELLDHLDIASEAAPEIRALVKRSREGGGQWQAILLGSVAGTAVGGSISSALLPGLEKMKQLMSSKDPFQLLPVATLLTLWYRKLITDSVLNDELHKYGFDDDHIKYLKDSVLFFPSPADIIRFGVREVYTPEVREQYGLEQDFPPEITADAEKAAVEPEQIMKYWAAHWELPSALQGYEMLHRGLITEDDLKILLRTLDVMPFWREKLIGISWSVPTRVDVRRFWDMRTIDEARLREVYRAQGYHDKDLDDYVLWTKVYVAFPDLLARWKNGWITEDELRAELTRLGMPADRLEEMIQTKVKPDKPERVANERDLTATDIIMGVKKEIINYDQGVDLLMDLGYDREEAIFKLESRLAAAAGSPETYEEFKDITTKYRRAIGKEEVPMSEEIKKAADEVVRLTKDLEALQTAIVEERKGLVEEETLPPEATKRLKELQVKRNRAEAALARAKSEYDRLVAEWRHGE